MRSVINVSLPGSMAKKIEKEIRKGGFISKSEFFRNLFRLWEEEKLLKELRESQREIVEDRGKVLRSLKDLR